VKPAPASTQGSPAHSGLASARVRDRMVERVRELGVRDPRVLDAMRTVPRHLFVDEALASRAYEDTALPIGHGQTISQPYIVARIAELALEGIADPRAARLLEIGTGCGYAAAVLAQLFGDVVSVERLRALGAVVVEHVHSWCVMQAPTGQRFCVVRKDSRDFERQANSWRE